MTRNYSISIQQKIGEVGSEPDIIASNDDCTLYRFADGVEGIEFKDASEGYINLWEGDAEFGETKEWIICKGEVARRE